MIILIKRLLHLI